VIARAKETIRLTRQRRRILCSCGKQHAIGQLDLLVTHWYVEPHGCTGGDYWNEGEWQFVCPTTSVRNRLMFDDYDRPWQERGTGGAEHAFKILYHGLFKSSSNTYRDENDPRPTWNNYYIDQHRERFELPAKLKKKEP
jgi:hypothetical protein